MQKARWPSLLLGVWIGSLAACAPAGDGPVPPGPLLEEPMIFEFAVYYTEPLWEDPQEALDDLLASGFTGWTRVDRIDQEDPGDRRLLSTVWVTDARQSYAAPGLELLRYSGRGLDEAQAEALQQSDQVLRLLFRHGEEHRWTGVIAALRLTSALAWRTGGLVWDEETREMFTPSFWDEYRIDNWPEGGIPDLRHHMTIHVYRKDNGYQRAVSLGLGKFGLPDLVAEDLSGSATKNMGKTITLLAQALAEGGRVGDQGELDLDLRSLGPSETRDSNLESLSDNATGKARLRLVYGNRQEGDAYNDLVEILFDRYDGPDLQARQDRMLAEFFGTEEDALSQASNDEILAASERARGDLAALKPAFLAGLPPGEILLVKAPFESSNGAEWMWVEVIEWDGDRITGTLQNIPVHATYLDAGQSVEVSEADVFDYIHRFPDGTEEGNETAKYLNAAG